MRDLICRVVNVITPRYHLCGSNVYQIGNRYQPDSGIVAVIGMYNVGVVIAQYEWKAGKKTYTNGTAQFYALTYQSCLVVASIYPLSDSIGQGFINNPSSYVPVIGDFSSTIPTQAITYRECDCKIIGIFLATTSSLTIETKKYVYKKCNFKVYITETIFPSSSGQALNGTGTGIENWNRC